jgi:hypothetical protein
MAGLLKRHGTRAGFGRLPYGKERAEGSTLGVRPERSPIGKYRFRYRYRTQTSRSTLLTCRALSKHWIRMRGVPCQTVIAG